ncbi:manganese catalase family protein [Bacillus salacetis]|uniref:Manganese catalase family protein n=1 Tax=Bacillus salacetis TaxID=2315464 RepID=A0A3A1R8X7_9BACI|nr:manganese catalase family protein [Bacillus salacetis]RIW38362.1 manganese catalase family protein [Bacillus salacetis]
MWIYEKKLLYPVKVSACNPSFAKNLLEAYGGQDGELSQSLRYLTQRYTMPPGVIAIINDIGTEELAHMEMIAALFYKLTKDATPDDLQEAGLAGYYVDHGKSIFYQNAQGIPWTAAYIQSKGDPLADLYDDIAAEEKARAGYQWLINLSDDPAVNDTLRFLREREIVHIQRLREAMEILKEE